MSDVSPYGVTQNADEVMVTANELVGEHAGSVTAHQADARFSPARFSTAPFKAGPEVRKDAPVQMRHRDGVPLCAGLGNTCGMWRLKGSEYCRHHQ